MPSSYKGCTCMLPNWGTATSSPHRVKCMPHKMRCHLKSKLVWLVSARHCAMHVYLGVKVTLQLCSTKVYPCCASMYDYFLELVPFTIAYTNTCAWYVPTLPKNLCDIEVLWQCNALLAPL